MVRSLVPDPRRSRAWRKLRDRVVREEPVCWLRLPGICTYWSETADHVQPYSVRPDLAMVRSNLKGACGACNRKRKARPVEDMPGQAAAPDLLGFFD